MFAEVRNATDYEMNDASRALSVAKVVSDGQLLLIRRVLASVYTPLAFSGILANVINIIVFLRIGVHDTMTVNFLSLSVADLGVTIFSFLYWVFNGLFTLQVAGSLHCDLDMYVGVVLASIMASAMTTGSTLLTTYMAVQRCVCVAFPFKFRNTFTKKQAKCIVLAISLVALVIAVFFSSAYKIEFVFVARSNISLLKLIPRPHRSTAVAPFIWVNKTFVNVGCQVIVSVCVIIMSVSLWRSAEFKRATTKKAVLAADSDAIKSENEVQKGDSEMRLLKSMCLIAAVFVLFNIPSVTISLARNVPGFSNYGAYTNVFRMLSIIRGICDGICSSVNIFIFMKTNKKYRKTFKILFLPGQT